MVGEEPACTGVPTTPGPRAAGSPPHDLCLTVMDTPNAPNPGHRVPGTATDLNSRLAGLLD